MKMRVVCVAVLSLLVLTGLVAAAERPSAESPSPGEARVVPVESVAVEIAARSALTSAITQYGITWTFDAEYEYGQFANGDYWVVGPVTIESITPAPLYIEDSGWVHGWQIDPLPHEDQHFDWRAPRSVPPATDFPLVVTAGSSVLKAISREPYTDTSLRPVIQLVAVLTVVDQPPPNQGAAVFRPPYVGGDHVYYSTADLRAHLLPSFPATENVPSLSALHQQLRHVQMDHHKYGNQRLRPMDALPYYAPAVNTRNAEAMLRLFLDDDLADKMPLLIAVVQGGIDYYHFLINGNDWVGNGSGEQPGNFLPITFAAYMLDNVEMMTTIAEQSPVSYEERTCYYNDDTIVLWGHASTHPRYEEIYWAKLLDVAASGSSTLRDPYGYIDGGYRPGGGYQYCCSSLPFKGTALVLHMLPALQDVWYPEAMLEYADRWVGFGTWTQPDPCAPATVEGVYGVDYGPDGKGGCILDDDSSDGIGRFPDLHGAEADQGHYGSGFVNVMWDAYRYARALLLRGAPGDRAIRLAWEVNATLPPTSTWRIDYYTQTGNILTATDSLSVTRAYTLTGLTNYAWYTVTLNALGVTPALSDTVRVMPTDRFVYLPLVLR